MLPSKITEEARLERRNKLDAHHMPTSTRSDKGRRSRACNHGHNAIIGVPSAPFPPWIGKVLATTFRIQHRQAAPTYNRDAFDRRSMSAFLMKHMSI